MTFPIPTPAQAAALEADDLRHRQLAHEAPRIGGRSALDHYRKQTKRSLEYATWKLLPRAGSDDDPTLTRQEADQLRLWHAAWLALEEREIALDQRKQRGLAA